MLTERARVDGQRLRYDGRGSIKTDHTAERSLSSLFSRADEITAAPAFDVPALNATANPVTAGIFFGRKRLIIMSESLRRITASASIKPMIMSAVR